MTTQEREQAEDDITTDLLAGQTCLVCSEPATIGVQAGDLAGPPTYWCGACAPVYVFGG